jgi:hypothetical protein
MTNPEQKLEPVSVSRRTANSEQKLEPLIISRRTAARMLDCSICHIDDLTDNGRLERVPLGVRKVGITWESLKRLAEAK